MVCVAFFVMRFVDFSVSLIARVEFYNKQCYLISTVLENTFVSAIVQYVLFLKACVLEWHNNMTLN
jgi:hypothetical protein